jgi:hypothetical protein
MCNKIADNALFCNQSCWWRAEIKHSAVRSEKLRCQDVIETNRRSGTIYVCVYSTEHADSLF